VRDVLLELVVGALLVGLGLAVVSLFAGERARGFDLDLAYLIGAAVFSVPAIVILELRRRRQRRDGW